MEVKPISFFLTQPPPLPPCRTTTEKLYQNITAKKLKRNLKSKNCSYEKC